jgi:hypothetical protein
MEKTPNDLPYLLGLVRIKSGRVYCVEHMEVASDRQFAHCSSGSVEYAPGGTSSTSNHRPSFSRANRRVWMDL